MNKSKSIFLIIFLIGSFSAKNLFAGEGMWLPQLLKALNEGEMHDLGFKLTAEDIYSINNGSLKDAIVHFGGFCTSEIISSQGLLLTNHHCGFGQIQAHSTLEKNYIEDGFWAMTKSEELANPGLTAIMIKRIDDVTSFALKGVNDDMSPSERQSAIDKNLTLYKAELTLSEFEEVQIKPFFKGNQYYMITTITYKDVRLVGAPPTSIGKFGSDTDNWVWPRHTGDFSLFRIYANDKNEPAEYSEDNVPYSPKRHLEVSTDGVKEGDFTLVFGFPGKTNEYLPSFAIDQLVNVLNPKKIAIREAALNIIDAEMKADPQIKIQYASKFARVANYWKKWIGESQGLKSTGAINKKENFEKELTQRILSDENLKNNYSSILPEFRKLYAELEPYAVANAVFFETFYRNIELSKVSYLSNNIVNRIKSGQEAFDGYKGRIKSHLNDFHKNYNKDVDQKVFSSLMSLYVQNCPKEFLPEEYLNKDENYFIQLSEKIFNNSILASKESFEALYAIDDMTVFESKLKADPAHIFFKPFIDNYFEKANAKYEELETIIEEKMRKYMAVQMKAFPNKRFYPDANSTMRVTYGQVQSYRPKDAVHYEPITYLEGVIEKYIPGDYEFDVQKKLIELYDAKDYGPYAASNGKLPVCFIGTNHTTGGNSGSPALDAHGRLIGLNFDRAWEGTMSDYNYDPSICRNIMVDIRYVLFIIDKFAGAGHLVEEMDLSNEKTNNVWNKRKTSNQ